MAIRSWGLMIVFILVSTKIYAYGNPGCTVARYKFIGTIEFSHVGENEPFPQAKVIAFLDNQTQPWSMAGVVLIDDFVETKSQGEFSVRTTLNSDCDDRDFLTNAEAEKAELIVIAPHYFIHRELIDLKTADKQKKQDETFPRIRLIEVHLKPIQLRKIFYK